jgi:hypothetical protein
MDHRWLQFPVTLPTPRQFALDPRRQSEQHLAVPVVETEPTRTKTGVTGTEPERTGLRLRPFVLLPSHTAYDVMKTSQTITSPTRWVGAPMRHSPVSRSFFRRSRIWNDFTTISPRFRTDLDDPVLLHQT